MRLHNRSTTAAAALMTTALFFLSAGIASAAPAHRPASSMVHRQAFRATSPLGRQICAGTGAFVFVLFSNNSSICYDGSAGSIPLGSNSGVLAVVLDNMSGHSVFMSGSLFGGRSFSYCYDRGFVFGLGPASTGEGGAANLYAKTLSEGSTTSCSTGTGAYGTSEPFQAPIPCSSTGGLYQGPLVYAYATASDQVNTYVRNWCEPGVPAGKSADVYTNPFGPYKAYILANGTRGALIVSGNSSAGSYTDCLNNNQVIDTFNSSTNQVTDIGVAAAGSHC